MLYCTGCYQRKQVIADFIKQNLSPRSNPRGFFTKSFYLDIRYVIIQIRGEIMLTDEKRKELLEKRKYYSEHPEEARKEYVKRKDDYAPVGVPPKRKSDNKNNK